MIGKADPRSVFITPTMVNFLGRKYTIPFSFLPHFTAGLLFIFGRRFWMVLAGRLLCGLGNAVLFYAVPIYSSEIASKEIRGSLGTILQVSCSLGFLIMVSIGPHLSYLSCNIMFTIFVVVTFIPSLFVPETPYCLFIKGKTEESTKLLSSLRGSKSLADEEISAYTSTTDETIIKSKIISKTFIKAMMILIILSLLGMISGHNCVAFYLQTICISTNSSLSPELATAVVAFLSFLASCSSSFTTDRCGRKPILCWTALGMSFGMIGLGTFFYLKDSDYEITGLINFVPLVSMILVVIFYGAETKGKTIFEIQEALGAKRNKFETKI
ncbi:facilitated trehalose transporter Tret1 [Amyelois transitella]|uniref:facilitated trehalose transporter Tret1 n=1 Tax=Amyelois transitella TaxID=680683 RepID=UPI0029901A77|nr:facilitated trehalose transporter Tret1 [Amyelois transitella]